MCPILAYGAFLSFDMFTAIAFVALFLAMVRLP